MEDYNDKEFIAYSRKLLRCLVNVRDLIEQHQYDQAQIVLDALIEDTQKDIEE